MTRGLVRHTGIGIAVVALLGFLGWAYYTFALPHWSNVPDMRRKMDRLNAIPRDDVIAMQIDLDLEQRGDTLDLQRPDDDCDIDRILSSLKRITVTETGANYEAGVLVVVVKGHPHNASFMIYGTFDPERAPIVSDTLQSDDLARVVQDICQRKGRASGRR